MPSQQEIDEQQDLLATYRRTLAHELRQAAAYGGETYAPPNVANGIDEAREHIAHIKTALRGWGVEVEDLPNDETPQSPVPPVLTLPHRQRLHVPAVWLGVAGAILVFVVGAIAWQARQPAPATRLPTAGVVAGTAPALAPEAATARASAASATVVIAMPATQGTPTPTPRCAAGALPIAGTVPASGVTYTEAFITSLRCIDIFVQFSALPVPTYVTVVRCRDSVAFTTEKYVRAPNSWYLIASQVLDDTCFKFRLRGDTGAAYTYSGVSAH
jgi:hypothetical protein